MEQVKVIPAEALERAKEGLEYAMINHTNAVLNKQTQYAERCVKDIVYWVEAISFWTGAVTSDASDRLLGSE